MVSAGAGAVARAFAAYGGAFVIGATLVSFPASSALLKGLHGLSDPQYGAIYLPQLVAAIVGAVVGGALSARWPLARTYRASLLLFLGAQIALFASADVESSSALIIVMLGTASFGFGFGLGGGPLNGLVAAMYPRRANAAITALHMCAGAGLTLAPLAFATATTLPGWSIALAMLSALMLLVLAASVSVTWPEPKGSAESLGHTPHPSRDGRFWIVALAAVAHALVEGTASNWAILYVTEERGLPANVGAWSLTAFWAALTLGRLLATLLAARVPASGFLLGLPPLMLVALLALRGVDSAGEAVAAFALAGLACSAYFPMLVAFAAGDRPEHVSWFAATLTAALMVGVGIGSYVVGAIRGALPIRELYLYAGLYPVVAFVAVLLCVRRSDRQTIGRADLSSERT